MVHEIVVPVTQFGFSAPVSSIRMPSSHCHKCSTSAKAVAVALRHESKHAVCLSTVLHVLCAPFKVMHAHETDTRGYPRHTCDTHTRFGVDFYVS